MNNWQTVCDVKDIAPNVGVCALINGQQIAIFNYQRSGALFAISNYDPIGKAQVLSRGIVGCLDGVPVVASPLYKQHFDLKTGQCIEEAQYSVKTHPIRLLDGVVQVQVSEAIAA
ncbi:nitrite reductase small subunit [Vibrio sp. UCD-FRSSP16_10]|uniref:nitrite reductase small subunit NirD n=1 Tax=unclassified Vibrio TaxID=2614977 RepID=UPI0007FED4D2|nr:MULTISPECIES: nitrite reductase small subunit NirD [unclassified Vibrio]OBT15567.1 nitrite reductase small subunit [Vibrio sp. UCD-FRSSP16_30]OBT20640.1 nitrite reductase small subunit [Vibrio sp. UCD-FRSSP16_10]